MFVKIPSITIHKGVNKYDKLSICRKSPQVRGKIKIKKNTVMSMKENNQVSLRKSKKNSSKIAVFSMWGPLYLV